MAAGQGSHSLKPLFQIQETGQPAPLQQPNNKPTSPKTAKATPLTSINFFAPPTGTTVDVSPVELVLVDVLAWLGPPTTLVVTFTATEEEAELLGEEVGVWLGVEAAAIEDVLTAAGEDVVEGGEVGAEVSDAEQPKPVPQQEGGMPYYLR
ncbi:uncharacterized protein LY89DRAFT_758707 [Mollisia scopiformis]|uniref:Uncharacterized protein n=1 Tax=Mollisia scopiformis TaxID=149040 RepID=A0A194WST5_MOLSC|nr:uncharacterized protein LY89DRAFT_758707 [Mollisia scopiformis]KUJ11020.1 hypothetical protein LY89DRAFT_758707 [Mollisia scopiformis]